MKLNKSSYILIVCFLSQLNIYAQSFDSSDLYFEEAKKDILEHNFTKAAKMSWRGLQLSPDDLDLKTLLGKAYLELGRFDTARYVLKQVLLKRKKDINTLKYLLNIEQTTNRYSDAICFVNLLLEIAPYSRSWWMRKITIYKEMGNSEEAERALKRLHQLYPNDTEIKNQFNYIRLGDAKSATESKKFKDANQIYATIIHENPANKEAYLGIIRNELLRGNPVAALKYANRSLLQLPNDLQLVEKKIGILEDLGKYAEAIKYIETLDKLVFKGIYEKTLPYLLQESARFNEYDNSYEVNKKIVELNGNAEAQDYVIKNALGKGYYTDAEYFLKKAIKKNPNSKKLLIQEMELYKPRGDKENFQKKVLVLHEKFPNDTDITYQYNKIMYERAKLYVENKQYHLALPIFTELTSFPDFIKEAEQQIFGILTALERYDEATDQIDKLIGLDPENPDYLVRKSTLYQKMELFDDALNIIRSLEQKYPLSIKYPTIYVNQIEDYATFLMTEKRYSKVLPIIEDGLTRDNNNRRLLDMAINASSAIPNYQKGINYSKRALNFYPNNKKFKLKLSNLYAKNKEYDSALVILDSLKKIYIYDRKIKNAEAEILFYKARNQEEEGLVDEALSNYTAAYSINPADEGSLKRMINLQINEKSYKESLDFISKKIEKNPEENYLKFKKGIVFELLKQYDSAYYYQKFRELDNPFEQVEWNRTLETLKTEDLENEIAVTYLEATSDSIAFNTSIASVNYKKIKENYTYGADMNYAARRSGSGLQGGVYLAKIFTPSLYADAGLLIGSKFFPKLKLYANTYKGLNNDFEAQFGLSYARLQNEQNYLTLKLGVAKYWEEITINARLSLMSTSNTFGDNTDINTTENYYYTNFMLQARINLNTRKDYFSVIASGGSAPFDQQLEYQENTFLNFSNVMVGAGYKYHMSPRAAILVNGTWINFLSNQTTIDTIIQDVNYTNQYNLSFTIITTF
ncbi:MAG: tetratricopeptide repeat protein [Polaribacter sp.]|nr:tetratricopeptide repeat protein [Polaribacter sp.]MDG1227853.1 tetratricopeptide repeat protein [Polaribacter sp.]